jgi:hypothetical protein
MWVSLHFHEILNKQQQDNQSSHEGKDVEQHTFAGMFRLILHGWLGHGMPLFAMWKSSVDIMNGENPAPLEI